MHFHLPHQLSRGRNLLNIYFFEEDWQSAITEIDCHPHETKVWSTRPGFFDGDHESHVLPIHVACSLHAPLEVIQAIVEAYPECLDKKESSFKRLPIHVACQFAAPVDVIEYLAQQYVAGTLEPDNLGRLPIHYACSNGAPMDVVNTLLRTNMASALYADYNGWLPIHVAVHFGAGTEVIRELVRVCPEAVSMKTRKRSTALTLAEKVKTKNKEEVVSIIKGAMVQKSNVKQLSYVRKTPMAA
ncbi:hypothetical protein ACHAXR_013106 [Thalassiosira sp. AJA248-18]